MEIEGGERTGKDCNGASRGRRGRGSGAVAVPMEEEPRRRGILRREVSREEVLEAIPDSYGLATAIAERLGCTINAVNAVLDERYEDIERALEAESDHQEDLIVKSIIDDAKGGDAKARELFLKTLARRHGAGGAKGAGAVTVKFNMPEPGAVTPETKSHAIGSWGEDAADFQREQQERVDGLDVESLLADARRLRPLEGR